MRNTSMERTFLVCSASSAVIFVAFLVGARVWFRRGAGFRCGITLLAVGTRTAMVLEVGFFNELGQ